MHINFRSILLDDILMIISGLNPILRFLCRGLHVVIVCFRIIHLYLILLNCGWVVGEVSVHDALLVTQRINTRLLRNVDKRCSIALAFIHFVSGLCS